MKRLICMVLMIAMMATGMMAFAENDTSRGGMGGGPNKPDDLKAADEMVAWLLA